MDGSYLNQYVFVDWLYLNLLDVTNKDFAPFLKGDYLTKIFSDPAFAGYAEFKTFLQNFLNAQKDYHTGKGNKDQLGDALAQLTDKTRRMKVFLAANLNN